MILHVSTGHNKALPHGHAEETRGKVDEGYNEVN